MISAIPDTEIRSTERILALPGFERHNRPMWKVALSDVNAMPPSPAPTSTRWGAAHDGCIGTV